MTAGLRARQALDAAANAAADAVAAARARVRSAQAGLDQAQADTAAARGALNAARDPLVPLGAPPAGDAALAAAWAELVGWASGQAEARAAELTEARAAAQAAAGQRDDARERFGRAEADLSRLRAEATRAAKAEQEARTRLAELTDRIAELDRVLRDAPDESQVSAQLALLGELEDAASRAGQRLVGARSNLGQAQQGVTGLERAESAARARLSATRDPLVRLGAPALDAHGLLAGWTALQAWAAAEACRAGPGHRARPGACPRRPRRRGAAEQRAERGPGGPRAGAPRGGGRGGRGHRGHRGAGAGPRRDQAGRGPPRPGGRPDRPPGRRARRAAGGPAAR